ncbi:MAG: hypothetical protein AAFR52_03260 [Pseudomonadota bacterium]
MGWTRVPGIPRRERPLRPDPDLMWRERGGTLLTPVEKRLLERRQAEMRARTEARTLVPADIEDLERRMLAERAVEENLARGRVITAHEVRKATDLRSWGAERGRIRFPPFDCVICTLARQLGLGIAALFTPFGLYALLVLVVL